MKIVILAAGSGRRLGGQDIPKPLTTLLNSKSILQNQLDNITQYSLLDNVVIVIGYLKELIISAYPNIHFVENSHYYNTNTAKSLLLALQNITEDVIWMNGDVVFRPEIFQRVLAEKKSCMVVNQTTVGEEEVKYRTDGNGILLHVSKQVIGAEGEALGINRFQAKDLPQLKRYLTECSDQDYFEKAIERCIENGMEISALVVDPSDCTEVDFPEDLERANTLLQKWEYS